MTGTGKSALNRVASALYGLLAEETAADGVIDERQGRRLADFAGRLYAKLRERAEIGPPRPPREFVSGEGFPYLGRSYRLLLVDEGTCPVVRLNRGRLELHRDRADDGTRQLVRWYRQAGERWLGKRIAPWAQRMEVEVADLRVLPLGYRWGSCTAVGRLNIHWATMQLSPDLVDYVLVHELAHIRHRDHGPDFWRAVQRPLPDFAARRTRLRLTGPALWLPAGNARSTSTHAPAGHRHGSDR